MSQETDDHMAAEMHLFRKLEREAADWKAVAERRRDELSGILEDVRALSMELATLRQLARDVVSSAARELNYSDAVLLVDTAALRALEKAL